MTYTVAVECAAMVAGNFGAAYVYSGDGPDRFIVSHHAPNGMAGANVCRCVLIVQGPTGLSAFP